MKAWKNRPVITSVDYPQTVYDALTESMRYYRDNYSEHVAATWAHTVENSREDLDSDFMLFAPEGMRAVADDAESRLYMSPDQLELALVVYGLKHLAEASEVQKVDELLNGIDQLKESDL